MKILYEDLQDNFLNVNEKINLRSYYSLSCNIKNIAPYTVLFLDEHLTKTMPMHWSFRKSLQLCYKYEKR